jgi:hypothetical protein
MLINDNLHKLLIYFRPERYWKLAGDSQQLVASPGGVGRYPIDLGMRLEQGHYAHFDAAGLPTRFSKDGTPYHNFTTLCSYALAHWDLYLLSGHLQSAYILQQSADFILHSAEKSENGAFMVYDDRKDTPPHLSAMNQGEAISVLTRAWEFTGDEQYLTAAKGCLIPFTRTISENGVVSPFSWNRTIMWYEEYTQKPIRHVLNGMIYALWGIRDLVTAAENELAQKLFYQGLDAIEQALPYFDLGFWSSYAVTEPQGRRSVASMMYHNLHTVQLQSLYCQTKRDIFRTTAERFDQYSQQCSLRFWAGFLLLLRNLKMPISHRVEKN